MNRDNRKVAIIGTGMVGMSYAYALLNQNACEELVLIDIDMKRAMGEAMDLNHGLAFSGGHMRIYAGEYQDCSNADLVVICAGVPQKPGQSRLDLLHENAVVFKNIINSILRSGFNGVFLVASNPVDIMTQITYQLSGFNANRVIGSGTTLDTSRLRYLLAKMYEVDPRNVHAYVMGEHGDTEFVAWSQANIASKPILQLCEESDSCSMQDIQYIADEVRDSAQRIIEAKRATYYGIGMALVRITKAILNNENSILTVSSFLRGEYGQSGIYVGVPAVVNSNGIQRIHKINLNEEEQKAMENSCKVLKETVDALHLNDL